MRGIRSRRLKRPTPLKPRYRTPPHRSFRAESPELSQGFGHNDAPVIHFRPPSIFDEAVTSPFIKAPQVLRPFRRVQGQFGDPLFPRPPLHLIDEPRALAAPLPFRLAGKLTQPRHLQP